MSAPTQHPAATARLRFRLWRGDDLKLARALWGDARVMRYLDTRGALDVAAVQQRLALEMRHQAERGYQCWPLFQPDGHHVGACGLKPRDDQQGVLELGFHLRPEHWGHGLGREAAGAVIAYAFAQLRASALFAGHHPENAASRLTLERLGFRYSHSELFQPTGLAHPGYLLVPSGVRP